MRSKLPAAVAILLVACGSRAETATPPTSRVPEPTTTVQRTTTTTIAATTTTATTTTASAVLIRVEGGIKVEGPDTISFTQGEMVNFAVVTDVADEVHVHGYDLFFNTLPGEATVVEFVADAAGIFEVELEGTHLDLVNIEVTP